ncbi:MAG: YceI family protein [Candidatus Kapaibacterium sp.]|jgi:polyisoprenoid-binding protein YceI
MKALYTATVGILLLMMIGVPSAQAEKVTVKSHKMTVAGTSTLHDWKCPASKLVSTGDVTMEGSDLKSVNNLWVEVESKSIKSDKDAMDEKIYEALKTDAYQKITFQMAKMKSIEKKGDAYSIVASGNLTIAGVSKPVELTVVGKVLPGGDIEFSGSKTMRMTMFNVDPPTAMWGVVKAGDEITIAFTLTMKRG